MNTLQFKSPVKLIPSFLIGSKQIIPNCRAIFVIDDLKRPPLGASLQPIDLKLNGGPFLRDVFAERGIFDLWVIIFRHGSLSLSFPACGVFAI